MPDHLSVFRNTLKKLEKYEDLDRPERDFVLYMNVWVFLRADHESEVIFAPLPFSLQKTSWKSSEMWRLRSPSEGLRAIYDFLGIFSR